MNSTTKPTDNFLDKLVTIFDKYKLGPITENDEISINFKAGILSVAFRGSNGLTQNLILVTEDTFENLKPINVNRLGKTERNHLIYHHLDKGATQSVVAELFGVSQGQISKLLKDRQ